MSEDFSGYCMVCNSTQNQVVNLIPALQFGIGSCFIISTEKAEKDGWTDRLVNIMNVKNIKAEVIKISSDEEKSVKKLSDKLLSAFEKYNKIFWNISGGQKIPTVALHYAFENRVKDGSNDDMVLYVEGNDANIFFYCKDYELKKQRIDVYLSLADLLYLNDSKIYEAVEIYPDCDEKAKKLIDIASKALEIYKNNAFFREAFFSLMATPLNAPKSINDLKESIKKTLNSLKPSLSELKLKKDGYQNLEDTISELNKVRDIKKVEEVIKKLKIIGNPKEIYEDYWNSIKKSCIEKIIKDIYSEKEPLFREKQPNKEKFIRLINELEGEFVEIDNSNGKIYKQNIKKLTYFSRNSELFEWMVAASILDAINKDSNIKNAISEVHCNVKTQQLNIDSGKYDAEIDVLITTKFGTLIVLEAKTYDFSGDTAKSRETIAYKKSGPFARAIIVGPLLTNIVKKRPDGSIECPDYIDKKTCDQPETAKINNITYWYLDEIQEQLKKELKLN